jgi:biopolymer transport protein ExbD
MATRLNSDDDDSAELHEINVTPFIDVMLVLLIIFMVAAPLSTVDIGVDLPVSNAKPQPRPDKPLFLTIKADLTLALGNDLVARHKSPNRLMRQRRWIAKSDCFCAPIRACPMASSCK